MAIDEQGLLWLANPWLGAAVLIAALGLVLWCHARLARADEREHQAPGPAHRARGRRPSGSAEWTAHHITSLPPRTALSATHRRGSRRRAA